MNNGSHKLRRRTRGHRRRHDARKTRNGNPHTSGRSRNSSISSVSSTSSMSGACVRWSTSSSVPRQRQMLLAKVRGRGHGIVTFGITYEMMPMELPAAWSVRRPRTPRGALCPIDQVSTTYFARRRLPHTRTLPGELSAASTPNVSDRDVDEKEHDETITRVAKRNFNGREARLLPFPSDHTNGVMPGALPGLQTPLRTGMSCAF